MAAMACVREHYGQIGEDAESRSLSFLNYNNTRNVAVTGRRDFHTLCGKRRPVPRNRRTAALRGVFQSHCLGRGSGSSE